MSGNIRPRVTIFQRERGAGRHEQPASADPRLERPQRYAMREREGSRTRRTASRRSVRPLAAGLVALLALMFAACGGGGEQRTAPSPPPSTAGSEGRPLGGSRSDAGAKAVAAATRFVRGYLA